jgi:phosphoketolase
MVPAYVGYLLANLLTGHTRGWLMGQGHCVSAIDGVNLLVDNMTPAHAARYRVDDEGLTRYVQDFYAYSKESPRGSHVNAHTAGGIIEGGYLGFAELEYVHMPLPGERLVAFLSDGAFEEQRGSDWAPRWWRPGDSGLVAPIMIANGRRIDQRTTMSQQGGVEWFLQHLRLNHFDPVVIDGRDPAAFAWLIVELERRLGAAAQKGELPVWLPYGVAVAPKGAGFHGEGTNLAHNLPLPGNPHQDEKIAALFNASAAQLHVPADELHAARRRFQAHEGRPRERDNVLARREVALPQVPRPSFVSPGKRSPMAAIDEGFLATVQANPRLRPRVGNPDEMKSNRMVKTLEALRFRVGEPEPGVPEAVDGAVITALNEEAVACAALANQGGINIVVTYEAFAPKMFGACRQRVIFARHQAEAGRPPGWLSVPFVLTSHTWENAKNEQSHQDPSMAELMLGEPSHVSRVFFPVDFNSAAATIAATYRTRGQIHTLVVPKAEVTDVLTGEQAERLVADGGLELDGHRRDDADLALIAVGAYQLAETLKASRQLAERGVAHRLLILLEPARFRRPRSEAERLHLAPAELRARLAVARRIVIGHTRPECLLGLLEPHGSTVGLGYLGEGGTLDTAGLLAVNRCTARDILSAAGSA